MFKAILLSLYWKLFYLSNFIEIKVFNGILSSGDECSAALLGKEEPLS